MAILPDRSTNRLKQMTGIPGALPVRVIESRDFASREGSPFHWVEMSLAAGAAGTHRGVQWVPGQTSTVLRVQWILPVTNFTMSAFISAVFTTTAVDVTPEGDGYENGEMRLQSITTTTANLPATRPWSGTANLVCGSVQSYPHYTVDIQVSPGQVVSIHGAVDEAIDVSIGWHCPRL